MRHTVAAFQFDALAAEFDLGYVAAAMSAQICAALADELTKHAAPASLIRSKRLRDLPNDRQQLAQVVVRDSGVRVPDLLLGR